MGNAQSKRFAVRLAEFFNPSLRKPARTVTEYRGPVRLEAPCMTVVNLFEMPGRVRVEGDCLVIQPCFGKATYLQLEDISGVEHTQRFNGTRRVLQYQHGFWVHGSPGWRLGFAVTDEGPWRALFESEGIEVSS